MLRDVFYYGKKPNVHPREKFAKNLSDARKQATTEHFWIINELCDYKDFDWEFDFEYLADEDVWAEDHNNVWPSQHQKDSGTWLCSKKDSEVVIYRNDVGVVKRKKEKTEHWKLLDTIDEAKWDYSWHPDPSDPPYIYKWGCKFYPVQLKPCIEYHVEGATEVKYMTTTVELLPNYDYIKEFQKIDILRWDLSWRPDPMDTPYIYVWGNKYVDGRLKPTLEYHVPGATEKKYMPEILPVLPEIEKFQLLEKVDTEKFDFCWRPDPTSPPYIYAWGNQWNNPEDKISIQYVVEGATEYKYMTERAVRKPCMDNWIVPDDVDTTGFDFSWEPSPAEPPYIYQFGTQWQKDGGPKYVVKGATEIKYIESQKVTAKPTTKNWTVPRNIDVTGFDFSWHPDEISPPYIYIFSTQWALTGGPVYTVEGAVEKKYVEYPTAVALLDKTNWQVPEDVDNESFDYSWHPFAEDDPCIYQIGTQWQKTGGPRYIVPGTDEMSPVKYIDRRIIKSKKLPNKTNFKILHPIIEEEFDWSWHPDETEAPYIYVFGNQHYSAEKMPTVEYHVEGATQYKFVNDIKATLAPSKNNWVIKLSMAESTWDFTWVPDPGEPPYIYVFGNQWHDAEIESTIEYHVPGATEKKYINTVKAYVFADMSLWKLNYLVDKKKFDFTWRPDPGSPPYIYVFGSNLYPAEEMHTVEYHVDGATEYKYMNNMVATLAPDKSKWTIPDNVDVTDFDFSWHPNPKDPPYIYYAGTQWQKSGGPKYVVEGATDIKYLEGRKVKALPDKKNWVLPPNIDVKDFDFSWHPDDTEPPYIYQFGTQWALTGGPRYVMPDATEIKYMDSPIAVALPDKTNWIVPDNIDSTSFDFSWHPYVEDQPYIYQFGTQWQKTGGPRYVTPGADEMSPVKYIDRRILKSKRLPDKTNWEIPDNIDSASIDYTWHPDETEQPYIYQFGTQWHDRGGPRYVVPDATAMKYSNDVKGKLLPERTNWEILTPIVEESFDFTWHPHPDDPPFIYVFGNNLYPAEEMETVRYVVPGASQIKYVNEVTAQLASDKDSWIIPDDIDTTNFDFSWKPHPMAPPYIYEFGTQWQKNGGPRYEVKGAKETNYIPGSKALHKPKTKHEYWQIPEGLDISDFDFSWHPDNTEKPYIYQFGTQWAISGGPKYVVPGATEIKYMENPVAKMRPNKMNWEIPEDIDLDSFDFSWHPYVEDQPYIYQFGTQWQKTGGPRYISEGADEMSPVKYIDRRILKATKLPNKKNFEILNSVVVEEFDYSWHPDETEGEYIYTFGNNLYPAEIMPTVTYKVGNATKVKYINEPKAVLGINLENYKILHDIDTKDFDFSWRPNPKDPPYVYVWGNQWNDAEIDPTVEYHVPDAIEKKYIKDVVAKVLPDKTIWKILHPIVESEFDFSWRPNPKDPAYIYVFGNNQYNAEKMPTLMYVVEGATEYKYINTIKTRLAPKLDNWNIVIPIDKTRFDFSWIPDPHDPPYIYVFGNQWNDATIESTVEYVVPGATEKKYITDTIAYVLPQPEKFEILFDIENFDFSWRPNPKDPAYIYVFGNQWNSAEKEPSIKYKVKNATDLKYMHDIVAEIRPNMSSWSIPEGFNVETFDFSWRPDPYDPPYIYEFATEYNDRGGPQYIVQRATEVKYMSHIKAKLRATVIPKYYIETTLDDLVSQHKDEVFWAQQRSINYDNFDFNWRPTKDQEQYVHVFGSPEAEKTQTYFINAPLYLQGYTDKNFVEQDKKVSEEYLAELFVQPDIFFVDRGNKEAQERFDQLKSRFTNVSKTRFLNSWVDTINRCINRSNTELCWILNSELDYNNFDFKYYPNPWQLKMVHVFGTQWSHWGTTFMVNRETFTEDTKYVKIIEHLSNLNFVKERRAVATNNLYDIIVINHGNKECEKVVASLEARSHGKKVTTVDYEESYLNTLKKIVNNLSAKKETFVWITSSVCSYGEFDFTYICDPFAKDSLHVFPSDRQKFGDTFLLDVNKAKEHIDALDLLQQYPKVNYNQTIRAKRLSAPVIKTGQDTHVEAITTEFDFPYAIFQTEELTVVDNEPMSLWTPDSKSILVTSTGGTRIIVPKEAKQYIKDQLYDYPYIKTASKLVASKPLDIVFLSNGEKCADENYEHLLAVTKGLKNRVVRVDGINGRVDAYQAAVKASETNWAFTVFAKLKVDTKFDWGWQPDRLQMPKHYIFHAKNPVNGLEYGHQGMIAYNKALTLNNFGDGLDFTLDDPHETVEILSGIATFNTDAYSTWRTAFREVIKLKSDYTDISQDRLKVWLTKAKGKFAQDCLRGANDAVEYYDSVSGDIDQLRLSYEWDWLKEYYNRKYK